MLVLAVVGSLGGCRPKAPAPTIAPERPAPATTASDGCGDGPACGAGLTCIEHYPIVERPSPPRHACERPCSFTGDAPCPEDQYCAMESAGAGLVCRPLDTTAAPPDIQRLVALAEVWSQVRFAHPWLATKPIDWDGALLRAIPRVRAAQTDAAMREAIGTMLAELGDPATRVVPPEPASSEATTSTTASEEPVTEVEGTVVVDFAKVQPWNPAMTAAIAEQLAKADRIVFDLRQWPAAFAEAVEVAFERWNPVLLDGMATLPTRRSRVFHGFPSEAMATSGGYYEAFESSAAIRVEGRRDARPPVVAFVVGDGQVLPGIALPLYERGRAVIVSPEALDARVLTPTAMHPLADGHYEIRVADPEYRGGTPALKASAITVDDPIARARTLLARHRIRPRSLALEPMHPLGRVMPSASASGAAPAGASPAGAAGPSPTEPPDLEHRMLNAIHVWSTLDVFHAYPDTRPRWSGALARALVAMDAAHTPDAYVRALLRLNASVDDGHSMLRSPHVREVLGTMMPSIEPRVIEGCVVVARIIDPERAGELQVGDVFSEIDGVSVVDRFVDRAPLVAGSTMAAHRNAIAWQVLAGSTEGTVPVVIDRDGERLAISMNRARRTGWPEYDRPTYERIADGTLGLVDLTRLTPDEVPAMFEALQNTKGIIFDMRGYPRGTAWTLAPYLDRHPGPTPAAEFLQPLIGRGSLDPSSGDQRTRFLTRLPRADVTRYEGPTVMLIDERAVSQAEYTGMFLRVANGTRFVGTPTAGANGDITSHVLPDGTEMYFTGQAVVPLSGPPLQRVGLQPDAWVAPTIAGLRAGRDEVLDAAIALLQ